MVDSKWDVFPLTKSISTGANPTAVDFNKLVDKFNVDAVQSDVYTVDKIHKSGCEEQLQSTRLLGRAIVKDIKLGSQSLTCWTMGLESW